MLSTPLLLPGLLWSGVVALERVLFMSNRTKLFTYDKLNCLTFKLCTYAKLNCLKFNSALNDPGKVDTLKNKSTNQPANKFLLVREWFVSLNNLKILFHVFLLA